MRGKKNKTNSAKSHQTLKSTYSEQYSDLGGMDVDLQKIYNGENENTTVCVKNIPNRYT
jgi:hypothetical protein